MRPFIVITVAYILLASIDTEYNIIRFIFIRYIYYYIFYAAKACFAAISMLVFYTYMTLKIKEKFFILCLKNC